MVGNPVVHFEIAGPDGPVLRVFYRDLFGWEIDVQGEEMGFYGLVSANEGGIGGGVFPTAGDTPVRSYVTFYVRVDDLQVALDQVADLGGSIVVSPMEIAPGMGSIAMFGDPAGNTVGLYSLPPGWDGQMPPKGNAPPVVHFEVGGSDAAALAEFYTEMFGWQIGYREETGYRLVQPEPGGIGGGIFQHTEEMPPNHPSVAVMVNDLQAYLDRAVGLGGSAVMSPTEIACGFGSIAVFRDIAGNRISLFKSPG